MVAAGISLRVVQDIGGWSTLRMRERYAHPSGAEMSRAVRVLTAFTATGTKTGTATENDRSASKRRGGVSAVKARVTKWRPQPVASRCARFSRRFRCSSRRLVPLRFELESPTESGYSPRRTWLGNRRSSGCSGS